MYSHVVRFCVVRSSVLALVFVLGLFQAVTAVAGVATVDITLTELDSALRDSETDADAVQQLVLESVKARLDAAGLQLDQGQLLYQRDYNDIVLEDGCTSTRLRSMDLQLGFSQQSRLSFELLSLHDPVHLDLILDLQIQARGRAQQILGFRLGRCQEIASDSFDVNVDGDARASVSLELLLNPVWLADNALQITPELRITGELLERNFSVDVDDSLFEELLEDFLRGELNDAFSPVAINQQFEQLQDVIARQLASTDAESLLVSLPDPEDAQIERLHALFSSTAELPLTIEFVRRHRLQLLVALVTGDDTAVSDIIEDTAVCQASAALQVDLSARPLFTNAGGQCRQVSAQDATSALFVNSTCSQRVEFYTTSLSDYCEVVLNENRLGNAESQPQQLGPWSLSPGNTFDIGALALGEAQQPYVQRRHYKSIAADDGQLCELEMRVYKAQPGQSAQPAVIAFHGGSWQYRATGFFGIELMATHLTNAGFTVFAPFYRLVGDRDGPAACQQAKLDDLIADADDALDWVRARTDEYSITGKPLLFGQSAGGHIAASLGLSRADDVDAAVLFYAPLDFDDFARQLQSGAQDSPRAQSILEAITGASLAQVDFQSPVVLNNSFPQIIAKSDRRFPPFFLLHGEMDTLVPFRQAVRFCNALGGSVDVGVASLSPNLVGFRTTYDCDARGSQLHLIAEGEHALDVCIAPGVCASGSTESAVQTAASIAAALEWMKRSAMIPQGDDVTAAGSGGGSAPALLLLTVLLVPRGPRGRRRAADNRFC